jgi:hypothetical protein
MEMVAGMMPSVAKKDRGEPKTKKRTNRYKKV